MLQYPGHLLLRQASLQLQLTYTVGEHEVGSAEQGLELHVPAREVDDAPPLVDGPHDLHDIPHGTQEDRVSGGSEDRPIHQCISVKEQRDLSTVQRSSLHDGQ